LIKSPAQPVFTAACGVLMAIMLAATPAAAQVKTKDMPSASVQGNGNVGKSASNVKAKIASKKLKANKKLKVKRARAKLPPAKTLKTASAVTAVAALEVDKTAPRLTGPLHVTDTPPSRNPYLPSDAQSNAAFQAFVAPVRVAQINPYLAYRYVPAADVTPPLSASLPSHSGNPYLAKPAREAPAVTQGPTPWEQLSSRFGKPAEAARPVEPPAAFVRPSAVATPDEYPMPTNPYLAASTQVPTAGPSETGRHAPALAQAQLPLPVPQAATQSAPAYVSNSAAAPLNPVDSLSGLFNSIRMEIPLLNDQAILPVIKTVYPTGEKPLKVLTFKCPTELVGISPPPTKALRGLIDLGMEAVNKADILPFDMQQVCQ